MDQFSSSVGESLLERLESAATVLGTTRSEIVERALRHYLDHLEEVRSHEPAGAGSVDWAAARRTMIASRCAYPQCPHAGDCPIELCPL